jgi:hypothetical protein
MARPAALLLATLLAACAVPPAPPVDTARLPNAVPWYLGDVDTWAINHAEWAFADPARTRNRPAEAARAIAALDYIAGQMNTSYRWANSVGPIAKMELLTARADMRAALGIAPNAPSQVVVNVMLAVADALIVGNPHAAMAAMTGPAFTRPPEQILASLAALPYIRAANLATSRANADLNEDGRTGRR